MRSVEGKGGDLEVMKEATTISRCGSLYLVYMRSHCFPEVYLSILPLRSPYHVRPEERGFDGIVLKGTALQDRK